MTPEQKVKLLVLIKRAGLSDEAAPEGATAENIDELYDEANDEDDGNLQDARSEVRSGEFETEIQGQYSRHYESKEVAAQMPDGSWVGWTYWYGGGKYGEPEAINWMDEAYEIDCTEEEKMVVVRTFAKKSISQTGEK